MAKGKQEKSRQTEAREHSSVSFDHDDDKTPYGSITVRVDVEGTHDEEIGVTDLNFTKVTVTEISMTTVHLERVSNEIEFELDEVTGDIGYILGQQLHMRHRAMKEKTQDVVSG